MREIRQSGSEGGEAETNRPSLPLLVRHLRTQARTPIFRPSFRLQYFSEFLTLYENATSDENEKSKKILLEFT